MITASIVVNTSDYYHADSTHYTSSSEFRRIGEPNSDTSYTKASFSTNFNSKSYTGLVESVTNYNVTYSATSDGDDGGYTASWFATYENWLDGSTYKTSKYSKSTVSGTGLHSGTVWNTSAETNYPLTTLEVFDTAGNYPSTTVLTTDIPYNDTDTYIETYDLPIISANSDGTYETVVATNTVSTSSSIGTLFSQTYLGTTLQPMTVSVGQTIIPAYYAQSNETLYLAVPQTGYPRQTANFSDAFIPLGQTSFRYYFDGQTDNVTSVLTIIRTSLATYSSTYDVGTSPLTLTVNFVSSASYPGTTTVKSESVMPDGRLDITTATIDHTYFSTVATQSNYAKTGTSTATRVGNLFNQATVNIITDYSTRAFTTFDYGGYTFTHGSVGLDVSSITLLKDSSLSYSTSSTASLKKVSNAYTFQTYSQPYPAKGSSTSEVTIDGNSSSTWEANSTVHRHSYLNNDNFTSKYRFASLYPLSSISGTQNTFIFGEAVTYENGNVIPSTDMAFSSGWGIGVSVPANISELAYTTSSVYDGVVYVTTSPRTYSATTTNSVKVTQSLDSITVTYGSTVTTTTPNVTSSASYSGSLSNLLTWGKTYFTNLGGTFVNNGFFGADSITLHLLGNMRVTSFNSTGGDTSSWTSSYDGAITVTGGDAYCFYKQTSGSVFALTHYTVLKNAREIVGFTKT